MTHRPPDDSVAAAPLRDEPDPAPLQRAVRSLVVARAAEPGDDPTAPDEGEESRERLAGTAERRSWVTRDALQAALEHDASAYARALRGHGMAWRQVLDTVNAVVRDAAGPSVGGARLDALLHEVGRCCVQEYFAG